jgi:surfeit locus 1 family protein
MKRAAPLVMTVIMVAILAGLGLWQVQRLQWKEALLQGVADKMAMKPETLPSKIESPRDWQYRRIKIHGVFIKGHDFLLKPRTKDGAAGYHLLTPLQRKSGDIVFVNRGFVDDAGLKDLKTPAQPVDIEGMGYLADKRMFTPENNPAKNDWYWADIPAMATAAHLNHVAPVIVSQIDIVADIPNSHQQYAIFWFSMAAICLLVYVCYARKKKAE